MSALISSLTEICGAIVTQVGAVVSTIVGNPLLLLTVGFLFFGGCIGIFGRLLSRN